MHFRQFYLGCLAHASYFIASEGEAAVVDPQRDVDLYIDEARSGGYTIKYVIETHLHADFVSGHKELAARTGARVIFGAAAPATFEFMPVSDGDEIRIGKVTLRFLETPGHTPESISVLVFDGNQPANVPYGVLTGDILFIGDVGRPDLLGSRVPATDLAGMLYDSLHQKLLALPDEVRVFPAHGAGSMCGRNISNERTSTIGHERRFNYALQPMPREQFIQLMTTDLPEAPAYFSRDARINMEGAPPLQDLAAPKPLPPSEIARLQKEGAIVLDVRPSAAYGTAHVPGSLHISLAGQFATWAGSLLRPQDSIVLVAEDEEQVAQARTRLARVGLDRVEGYLDGGILAWDRAGLTLQSIEQISVEELSHRLHEGAMDHVIDVRRPAEWKTGHIPSAMSLPLTHLKEDAAALDRARRIAVLCAGGFRSAIASSLLERQGFGSIANVVGGMAAWAAAKLPTTVEA
jgi:glyoxylase-like metal-dependent hydrolase (beta-lactamase superfamily II)/rhodanese-related sulfurtransferase